MGNTRYHASAMGRMIFLEGEGAFLWMHKTGRTTFSDLRVTTRSAPEHVRIDVKKVFCNACPKRGNQRAGLVAQAQASDAQHSFSLTHSKATWEASSSTRDVKVRSGLAAKQV